MRKLIVLSVLILIPTTWAGTAQAREVINTSGSQEEVSVSWFSETGEGGFVAGSATGIAARDGEPFVTFYEDTFTPIVCDNGTPDDPTDDFTGYHYESVSGSGSGTVEIDKQYRSGSATAVLDLFVNSFDDCSFYPENGGEGTIIEDVPVTISATATSALTRSTSSSGFHIPGEINDRFRFDSRYRTGDDGGVTWGDQERTAEFTQIGKISWRSHSNS